MSTPPLISSQRYLNREVIARKVAKFKVFVVRTVDLEMRGSSIASSLMAITIWQQPDS